MGFPLIHNVPRFSSYGYYYEGNDFDAAAAKIEQIVASHNPAQYRSHAEQLTSQFSIYNPENIRGWRALVSNGPAAASPFATVAAPVFAPASVPVPVVAPVVAPVAAPQADEKTLYFRYLSPQNFYHYLIYMLSNLRHVPDYTTYTSVALQSNIDVIKTHRYVTELLQVLIPGLRSMSLVSAAPVGSFEVPYIPNPDPLPRDSDYAKEAYTFLQERFLPSISSFRGGSTPKRIYISRKGATKRRVLNEDEVETTLKEFGFTTVLFETMGGIEQMAVARNAESIVSAHGAALVNTVFCKPSTRVVEFCTAKQSSFRMFSHIAECVGLSHRRFLCEPATDWVESDMRVDCAALRLMFTT